MLKRNTYGLSGSLLLVQRNAREKQRQGCNGIVKHVKDNNYSAMSKRCLFAMLCSVKVQRLQTGRVHFELVVGFWFNKSQQKKNVLVSLQCCELSEQHFYFDAMFLSTEFYSILKFCCFKIVLLTPTPILFVF